MILELTTQRYKDCSSQGISGGRGKGFPGILGLGLFLEGKFRDLGTEPFPGRWESEIKIFNREVGNALLCTMGTLEIVIISGNFFWESGIGHPLSVTTT